MDKTRRCPFCAEDVKAEAVICWKCQRSIAAGTCMKCGRENRPEARFCGYCGSRKLVGPSGVSGPSQVPQDVQAPAKEIAPESGKGRLGRLILGGAAAGLLLAFYFARSLTERPQAPAAAGRVVAWQPRPMAAAQREPEPKPEVRQESPPKAEVRRESPPKPDRLEPVLQEIGALQDAGSPDWDREVKSILLREYDRNGSGHIDSVAEVNAIDPRVWELLNVRIRSKYAGQGLPVVYGFAPGYGWVGDSLGFDESVRQTAYERMEKALPAAE